MLNSLFENFKNIIVFDIETTGMNSKSDEIIEIAMLRIVNEQGAPVIADEFGMLVTLSPGKRLPPKITELTGITEEQLDEGGIDKEVVAERIAEMLSTDTPLLVAYNAQFDLGFLYHFLNNYGKAGLLKNVKMLDALTVFKDRKPYPHKLSDAAVAYSINMANAHRALDDTKITYEVLCEMDKESDDLVNYVNLFGYNPKYGVSGAKISSVKYLPQPYNNIKKLYDC